MVESKDSTIWKVVTHPAVIFGVACITLLGITYIATHPEEVAVCLHEIKSYFVNTRKPDAPDAGDTAQFINVSPQAPETVNPLHVAPLVPESVQQPTPNTATAAWQMEVPDNSRVVARPNLKPLQIEPFDSAAYDTSSSSGSTTPTPGSASTTSTSASSSATSSAFPSAREDSFISQLKVKEQLEFQPMIYLILRKIETFISEK